MCFLQFYVLFKKGIEEASLKKTYIKIDALPRRRSSNLKNENLSGKRQRTPYITKISKKSVDVW